MDENDNFKDYAHPDDEVDDVEAMVSQKLTVGIRPPPVQGLKAAIGEHPTVQSASPSQSGEIKTPDSSRRRRLGTNALGNASGSVSRSSARVSGQNSRDARLSGLLGMDLVSSGEIEEDASGSLDDDDIEAIMARAVGSMRPAPSPGGGIIGKGQKKPAASHAVSPAKP